MSIYLIDYENTGISGLTGIETLKKNDRVYLFYGIYTGSITFDTHIALNNTKAKIKYIKIDKSAKNYLDFQLATMSGYLIAKNKDTNFIIVSRDNGFNSVVDFWSTYHSEKKPITITRQIAIAPTEEMLIQEEQRHATTARPPRRSRSGSFRSRRSTRTTETPLKEVSAKEPEETTPAPTPKSDRPVPAAHEKAATPPVQKAAIPAQVPTPDKQPAAVSKESVSKPVATETEKKSPDSRTLGPRAETRLQPVTTTPTREKEVPAAYTRIGPVTPATTHVEPAPTKPAEPKAHDSTVAYAKLTPVVSEKKEPEQKDVEVASVVPETPTPTQVPSSKPVEKPAPAVSAPAVQPVKEEKVEPSVSSSKDQEAEPAKAETSSQPQPEAKAKQTPRRASSRKTPAKKEPATSDVSVKEESKKEPSKPDVKQPAPQKAATKKAGTVTKRAQSEPVKTEPAVALAETKNTEPAASETKPTKKPASRTRSRQTAKKEPTKPKVPAAKVTEEKKADALSETEPTATSVEKVLSTPKKEIPKLTEHYKKRIRDRIRVEGLRSGAYNEIYRLILKSTDLTGTRSGLVRLFGEEKGNSLFRRMEDICEEYLREKRQEMD